MVLKSGAYSEDLLIEHEVSYWPREKKGGLFSTQSNRPLLLAGGCSLQHVSRVELNRAGLEGKTLFLSEFLPS